MDPWDETTTQSLNLSTFLRMADMTFSFIDLAEAQKMPYEKLLFIKTLT